MAQVVSALQTLLSFAVLISVLVFIHELGHLLVGQWLGVRALKFSLGFGPRLAGFTLRGTEYRLSAVPLGGYVKFAGDVPGEEVAPEDRGRGFLDASPGVRAAIAFAGPAANFLLAVVVFFAINLVPQRQLASVAGTVLPGSAAERGGLLAGDKVVAVAGEPVRTFDDMRRVVTARAGVATSFDVLRAGAPLRLEIVPELVVEKGLLGTTRQGRIGVLQTTRAPVIAVTAPAGLAGQAGLATFDRIAAIDGVPVRSYEELLGRLGERLERGGVLALDVRRRPAPAPVADGAREVPTLKPEPAVLALTLPLQAVGRRLAPREVESALGLASADLSVYQLTPGGAAEKGGLQRGDRLLELAGKPLRSWAAEFEALRQPPEARTLLLVVERGGVRTPLTIVQEARSARDDAGQRTQRNELGAVPDREVYSGEPETVEVRHGPVAALGRAVAETAAATTLIAQGLAAIVTARVSTEAIGGPLMLAGIARQAADAGLLSFLGVLAVISVNLGLLNLLPVPVLDGGHIVLAAVDAVRGRGVPLRVREVANLVGLAMVAGLTFLALRNDFVKWIFG